VYTGVYGRFEIKRNVEFGTRLLCDAINKTIFRAVAINLNGTIAIFAYNIRGENTNAKDPKIQKRLNKLRLKCRTERRSELKIKNGRPSAKNRGKIGYHQFEVLRRSGKMFSEVRLKSLAQPKAIRLQP